MTDLVTIPLTKPVTHGDKTYSELTFREATVGDMMAGDLFQGEFSKNVAVLAAISDVPLPAFKQISARDLKAILERTKGLMGNGEMTGA